jgi:inner membrane transporter RhtA
VVSAVFHYLGPSLAVLLFAHVAVLGVMWLRIASAAVVFAAWRRPWRLIGDLNRRQRARLLALGGVLAVMNSLFYLAVSRLPLATVGSVEFLGTVVLAAAGARTRRNVAALALTIAGVATLTVIRFEAQPLGFAFAFGNCACFMAYVVLGHRIASDRTTAVGARATVLTGIDQVGAAMLIAAVLAAPVGLGAAAPAFQHPAWLAWGAGVGVCSSVIPYVTDQLAMARLPRATFALMLALLPAIATLTGTVILGQNPTARDLAGIALVIVGVAAHRDGECLSQAALPSFLGFGSGMTPMPAVAHQGANRADPDRRRPPSAAALNHERSPKRPLPAGRRGSRSPQTLTSKQTTETETDHHGRDHRPRPHRPLGPSHPGHRRAPAVLALAARGHRHLGLDQVRAAPCPPVAAVVVGIDGAGVRWPTGT